MRDRKTYDTNGQLFPEENIEDIIRAHTSSMKDCREALWIAAERGGWYDNVTAILCQITDGPESLWATTPASSNASKGNNHKNKAWQFVGGVLLFAAAIVAAFFIGKGYHGQVADNQSLNDSVTEVKTDSETIIESAPTEKTDASIEETTIEVTTKPSVQEQIKKQAEEKVDSTSRPNALNKIEKGDSGKKPKSKSNGTLTPIEDKFKKDNTENPLAPTKPTKNNITDAPLNN